MVTMRYVEREEEYAKARARIFGREEEQPVVTTNVPPTTIPTTPQTPLLQNNEEFPPLPKKQNVHKKLADNEFMDFYR